MTNPIGDPMAVIPPPAMDDRSVIKNMLAPTNYMYI
jgi:hypothetical protein